MAWYRYNHDAYGERLDGSPYDGRSGVGRLWTLLTGERGEYELASGNRLLALQHLDAMASFANAGMMIPEQVWNRSAGPESRQGTGTGSATPLAWSMAQYLRLAVNISRGRNFGTGHSACCKRFLRCSPLLKKQYVGVSLCPSIVFLSRFLRYRAATICVSLCSAHG